MVDKKKTEKKGGEGTSASSNRPSRKRAIINYNEDALERSASEAAQSIEDEEKQVAKKRKVGPEVKLLPGREPLPKRSADGKLHFDDYPAFTPNLTPAEVLQRGSFGGTYFRPIYSSVTGKQYDDQQWQEFPKEWFEGLNIKTQVTSKVYREHVNRYGAKCGAPLDEWEGKGWISEIDPYGWFQWYCRFYLGRRSEDDERQIGRGLQVMGPTGRFRIQLMNRIGNNKRKFDDLNISPVIRQTLQHWGYVLTEDDYTKYAKKRGFLK